MQIFHYTQINICMPAMYCVQSIVLSNALALRSILCPLDPRNVTAFRLNTEHWLMPPRTAPKMCVVPSPPPHIIAYRVQRTIVSSDRIDYIDALACAPSKRALCIILINKLSADRDTTCCRPSNWHIKMYMLSIVSNHM